MLNYLKKYSLILNGRRDLPLLRQLTIISIGIFVVFGAHLRIGNQATKDFWADELWRVQQIENASGYIDLLSGNYWGEEGAVQLSEYIFGEIGLAIFGSTEIAFRLWPLIFSLLSLLLFAYIAINIFSPAFASLAVFVFASTNGFIQHALEFKPYSLDICFSLALLAEFIRSQKVSGNFLNLIWILTFFCWFSNNSIFFLFIIPFFVLHCLSKKSLSRPRNIIPLVLIFLALLYQALYAINLSKSGLFEFWEGLSFHEKIDELAQHYISITRTYFISFYKITSFEIPLFILTISLLISPILMLLRRDLLGLFLILPFALQLFLNLLNLYPILTRVSCFYFPLLQLSFLYFFNFLWSKIKCKRKLPEYFLLLGVLFYFGKFCLKFPRDKYNGTNYHIQESSPLIFDLDLNSKNGEIFCPNYTAKLALLYYKLKSPKQFTKCNLIQEKNSLKMKKNFIGFLQELSSLSKPSSVWIFNTHNISNYQLFKDILKDYGVELKYDRHLEGAFLLNFIVGNQHSRQFPKQEH